jgi:hypothetical protein
MTYSYYYRDATRKTSVARVMDRIRDLIGDVGLDDTWWLTDEEILLELVDSSNVHVVASRCARKIASRYAPSINKSISGINTQEAQIFEHWNTVADQMLQTSKDKASVIPEVTIGVIADSEDDNYPAIFRLSDQSTPPEND